MSSPNNPEQPPLPESPAATAEENGSLQPLEELRAVYGAAFIRYEERHGQEQLAPDEVMRDFLNRYWATFPDRKAFIDSTLAMLGWDDVITDVTTRHGITPELLNWNYGLLLEKFQEVYEISDSGGATHVFLK